ncbi:myc target protein 1 [Suncus etruscus]|uniref:myc target protein 1 n=1 Tax=Suncus etruscus TaxID=109475 RepID=UPI0021108F2D|nr:myc target protein 1 [Suncus etruscus]
MQTKYMTGCENYFLLLYHRHKNQSAYFDYWLFFLFSFSLFLLVDRMANNTSLGSPWPENFWENLITSFTVSMAIGLVIGGLIWALLVCLSRRRASAPISQWSSNRRLRSSYTHGLNRTGFYRHSGCERRSNLSLASLTFQRQASMDQANSFPRKSSFRASTFHPFLQSPPLPVETDSQLMALPTSNISSSVHSLGRPDFHWSSNNLRLDISTPPPPAYESIIKAFPDS